MSDKRYLSSLKRGLRALSVLNSAGRITTTELARELKIPRTTAHRILETLAAEGYIAHDPIAHSYYLLGQVRQLSQGFNLNSLVAEAARPLLRQLCQKMLMPVGLTTLSGTDMIVQISMDYEAPLALMKNPEGTAFPITFGPTGHVFLAFCDVEARRKIIALSLANPSAAARRLPATDIPSDSYLDGVRRKKFAIGLGVEADVAEGVLAVPVFHRGGFAAALYMRFMKRVLSADIVVAQYLPDLAATATAIEQRMLEMGSIAPRPLENPGLLASSASGAAVAR